MTDHQSHSRTVLPQQRPASASHPTAGSSTGSPARAASAGFGVVARQDGPATMTTDRRTAGGYETGESSSSAARRREPDFFQDTMPDSPDNHYGGDHLDDGRTGFGTSGRGGETIRPKREDEHRRQNVAGHAPTDDRASRKHRNKMSGGFLLRNPLAGGRSLGFRRSRASQLSGSTATPSSRGPEASPRTSSGSSDQATRRSSGPAYSPISGDVSMSAGPSSSRRFSDSHPQQEQPTMDADSSQIVLMALNLSESRRMAARRNTIRSNPPRLAPVPDPSHASNLKQHLQQQRKTSRGPRALQEASSGTLPIPMADDSFQPMFDSGLDLQYNYHFSPSTLARAQKAKGHLELLAQYRRLLEVLPPLKPGAERPASSSPPDSPVGQSRRSSFGAHAPPVMLGRQYNPLQYVRNRKVRARERQTIDGERQGFNDVTDVKSWVDTVSNQMSLAGTSLLQGKTSIPIFPAAEDVYNQDSAASLARMPSTSRGPRPRVDWFVEPCDMIADAYWLEKDRHKNLIEDRHWRRIFPTPTADVHHRLSGEEGPLGRPSLLVPTRFSDHDDNAPEEGESSLSKIRTDVSHSSAKERAKQKLQHLRDGFHHRHSASGSGHDHHRLKKGSSSDLSDSDEESGNEGRKRSRPTRKGTISSNTTDLLQKQMMEMLAREAMENDLEQVPESPELGMAAAPDHQSLPKPSSRLGGRRGSMADLSDLDLKNALDKSRIEILTGHGNGNGHSTHLSTSSAGNWSSNANSPETRFARPQTLGPSKSLEPLPPLSRSSSPSRKPLDKIKRILRDKSNEIPDPQQENADEERDLRVSRTRMQAATGPGKKGKRQGSPNGKLLTSNLDGTKIQRSISKRPKGDEAVGLRSMFKGPRIDTVIRDSVFRLGDKLGDKIWKRDATTESPDLDLISDSDNDKVKRPSTLSLSRKASGKIQHGRAYMKKHLLDTMPPFQHASNDNRHTNGEPDDRPSPAEILRRSRLEAPHLPPSCKPCSGESDLSEIESCSEALEGAQDSGRCLNPTFALTRAGQDGRLAIHRWSPMERGAPKSLSLSRREIARIRTLILSSGIRAAEIHRQALEQHKPFSQANVAVNNMIVKQELGGIPWSEIMEIGPKHAELLKRSVPCNQIYPFAAHALNVAIQSWGHKWQTSAGRFTSVTSVELSNRAWEVRTRLAVDLTEMTRKAADEADETSRDLALGQPLKVKHVVDTIEKMLRKRRRRFRWIRRGMWLTVEWLLVGLMWYVWFMVMVLRVFLGVGRGVFGCVKWLLWL